MLSRCIIQQYKGHVHLEGTGQRASDTFISVAGTLAYNSKKEISMGETYCAVLKI